MCGIGGCAVGGGGEPDAGALARIAAAMRHRGPDDSGIEVAGGVGLVNTRLAIVDTSSSGHQPMADPRGRWWLTYNGEIFNHGELRERLGGPFRGGSDTETLLHALARWGPAAAADRCQGFFAFAALDAAERELHLVRDRLGVKPLYMARHGNAIWFASGIGALLAAGVPARPNVGALWSAVDYRTEHDPRTPLEGIERVPPGSIVTVDLETLEAGERRWWEPARAVDPELSLSLAALDRARHAELVEEALREGVRNRLMADVPVGMLLSGGLDSSLVSAFVRDEDRSAIAFTASQPDEGETDERRWGEKAASALGIELETVMVGSTEWRAALVDAVQRHEYPLRLASSVAVGLLAAAARRRGVKVLLTGEAADELFGGYLTHHLAEYRAFLPATAMARRRAQLLRAQGAGPVIRGWAHRVVSAFRSPAERSAPRANGRQRFQGAVRDSAGRAYGHHPGPRGKLEAALLADLTIGTFPTLLARMDKDAMGQSIETRLPFLDAKLVPLALNLPLESRVEPDSKGVLRDVARRVLPAEIAARPKLGGMSVAARRIEEAASPGFLEHGMFRDVLQQPRSQWHELVRDAPERTRMRLWTGEIWCRLFVAGQTVPSVERDLWVSGQM